MGWRKGREGGLKGEMHIYGGEGKGGKCVCFRVRTRGREGPPVPGHLGPTELLLLKGPPTPKVEQGHLGSCTLLMLQAGELGKQNV